MANNTNSNPEISRHDFPPEFLFGAGTAAYQVEGAYNVGGKGMSNWDVFSLTQPGLDIITDGDNGCVAIDHYHRFKEDVLMMKKIGLDYYRFSISWSRILPGGKLSMGVSKEGIKFYNDLIDFIIEQGIQPFVTLFHFDLPEALAKEYGGFEDEKIIQDFADYADVCFFEFGNRVKHWITHNEPWSYTFIGYVIGLFPPNHGSPITTINALPSVALRFGTPQARSSLADQGTVPTWDVSREPYKVAHNLILSHAKAVDVYRRNYKDVQGGIIGMTNMTTWFYPFDLRNPEDVAAASRAIDFMWGWFVEPMVLGDYPRTMKDRVGDRLPTFTPEMRALVQGSYDFIGMQYYTSNFAANQPNPQPVTSPTYITDQEARFTMEDVDGNPIGVPGETTWQYSVPNGLYDLLNYTKIKYNNPLVYITENGWGTLNDKTKTVTEGRLDPMRVQYHSDHLKAVKRARDLADVNVMAYFLWSVFDNFEWTFGYSNRFGIVYVDYKNDLNRYPKSSAIWYMNFLNKNPLLRSKRQADQEKDGVAVKRTRNR